MQFISLFLVALSGMCIGVKQFATESDVWFYWVISGVFFVLGSELNDRVLKPKVGEKLKKLHSFLHVAKACQLVGLENCNNGILNRYRVVSKHIKDAASSQSDSDKELIIDIFNSLGECSEKDLVTATKTLYRLGVR